MGSFSNEFEKRILNTLFGNEALTVPGTLYLALFTVDPGDAGGGTEVSGGSYARLSVTNNTTNFPSISGSTKLNGVRFEFVQATANWGTVTAVGVFDASSGGNLVAWGALSSSKTINSGDRFVIEPGGFVVTLD